MKYVFVPIAVALLYGGLRWANSTGQIGDDLSLAIMLVAIVVGTVAIFRL